MKTPVYIAFLIVCAVSARAFDYNELGYERVINEEYVFSFWLPPDYQLVEEEVSKILFKGMTYKFRWGEGDYKGLMAAILVVDRQNGLLDLDMLKEANDKYFESAEIKKIDEKPLDEKPLIIHDASEGYLVTARYSKKDEENILYDYSALYLQKGVNLFVVSCVSPAEGAKNAKKASGNVIDSFRCSTEELLVPETTGGNNNGKNDRNWNNKKNKDK